MEMLNVMRKNDASGLVAQVENTLTAATMQATLDSGQGIYSIDGMSGKKYRFFINNLVRTVANPRYLEVGSWARVYLMLRD